MRPPAPAPSAKPITACDRSPRLISKDRIVRSGMVSAVSGATTDKEIDVESTRVMVPINRLPGKASVARRTRDPTLSTERVVSSWANAELGAADASASTIAS
jgi:hypothetical protein